MTCNCPPTRGQLINRRAYVGSQLVALRAQIPELEKTARKTPPKTLKAEWARVEQAKVALAAACELLPKLEEEYVRLRESTTTEHTLT